MNRITQKAANDEALMAQFDEKIKKLNDQLDNILKSMGSMSSL